MELMFHSRRSPLHLTKNDNINLIRPVAISLVVNMYYVSVVIIISEMKLLVHVNYCFAI